MGYYAGVDTNRRCGESYLGPRRPNDSFFLALIFDVQPDGFSSCATTPFAGPGEQAGPRDLTVVHELFTLPVRCRSARRTTTAPTT